MSTSYLVNIVANDFKDGSGIFDPFQLDQEPVNGAGVTHTANGIIDSIKETVKATANGLTNGH
jgi:methylenetetrahydrofolate reductase (NADPH)